MSKIDHIEANRLRRMEKVDDLPADVRACVHDYGLTVVNACLELGIHQARHIRHIVETVLNEFSPTRGADSAQGARSNLAQIEKHEPEGTDK